MRKIPGTKDLYVVNQLNFDPTQIKIHRYGFRAKATKATPVIVLGDRVCDEAVARVLIHSHEQRQWVGVSEAAIVRTIHAETTGTFAFWQRIKANARERRVLAALHDLYNYGTITKLWDSGNPVYFPTWRLLNRIKERGYL